MNDDRLHDGDADEGEEDSLSSCPFISISRDNIRYGRAGK